MNELFNRAMAITDTPHLTMDALMATIDALERKPIFPAGHPFHDVYDAKECAGLKGMQTVIINGNTAYFHRDMLGLKELKVLRLPKLPEPELKFSWNFTLESTINWEL